MHTVDSPEGRQNYVFVVPDLDVGPLDNAQGREVSGASRSFVLGGDVYVADGETATIQRFQVDDALNLVPGEVLSMQNHGVTYFDTGWTFIDDEKAYYMNSEQLEVIVWNPREMTISGTIDLSSLRNPAFPNFYADGGTLVENELYAMFWNDEWDAGRLDRAVNVAVIDTSADQLSQTLRDERCASAWSGSRLPDGHFYIPGNNGMSHYTFSAEPPLPENCLLRIDTEAIAFDPGFYREMNALTAPLLGGSTFDYSPEARGAVVWAHEPSTATTSDDFFPGSVWRPMLVDTETWQGSTIDDSLSATGWVGETMIVDGVPHFTVTDTEGRGSLVELKNGVLTPKISFSHWLQVVKRVR